VGAISRVDCQKVVAGYGVTFPAIHAQDGGRGGDAENRGGDATAFLQMATEQTFLTPIAENAAQAGDLMKRALESVFIGKPKAGPALKSANDKINKLFR